MEAPQRRLENALSLSLLQGLHFRFRFYLAVETEERDSVSVFQTLFYRKPDKPKEEKISIVRETRDLCLIRLVDRSRCRFNGFLLTSTSVHDDATTTSALWFRARRKQREMRRGFSVGRSSKQRNLHSGIICSEPLGSAKAAINRARGTAGYEKETIERDRSKPYELVLVPRRSRASRWRDERDIPPFPRDVRKLRSENAGSAI